MKKQKEILEIFFVVVHWGQKISVGFSFAYHADSIPSQASVGVASRCCHPWKSEAFWWPPPECFLEDGACLSATGATNLFSLHEQGNQCLGDDGLIAMVKIRGSQFNFRALKKKKDAKNRQNSFFSSRCSHSAVICDIFKYPAKNPKPCTLYKNSWSVAARYCLKVSLWKVPAEVFFLEVHSYTAARVTSPEQVEYIQDGLLVSTKNGFWLKDRCVFPQITWGKQKRAQASRYLQNVSWKPVDVTVMKTSKFVHDSVRTQNDASPDQSRREGWGSQLIRVLIFLYQPCR